MGSQASLQPGPLLVCNWGLISGQEAGPLVWGNLACGASIQHPPLPAFESAGFPQSTMAYFRMTLPEAEVNQPSEPPLSIFSLGEGKALSFTATSSNSCSHTGFGRSLRI